MAQGSGDRTVEVVLTEQQWELLEEARESGGGGSKPEDFLRSTLRGFFRQEMHHRVPRRFQPSRRDVGTSGSSGRVEPGPVRQEWLLQPVSGKAIPVRAGEVLRIAQVEGEQCVDFNAFSLEDHGERMSVGHSRRQGFRLFEGDVVLSNRHRPLLAITHMPQTCVTDLLGARCNAVMFERKFGFAERKHTNCQDTLAESIREFGLSSDDVHDSFNMWMNTSWDGTGNWWVEWNSATPEDHVDLLACYDTLCVPVVCGSGDVHPTSNFFLRPIRVAVNEASAESAAAAERVRKAHEAVHAGVRTGGTDGDRSLRPIEDYAPRFVRHPLETRETRLDELDEEIAAGLRGLVEQGWARDRGDAARKAIMLWYLRNAARNTASVGGRFRW